MHPAEIKASIEIAKSSMSLIARALGVSPQAVRAVVHGHARSKRIEEAISKITKIPLDTIWPNWYGKSKTVRRRVNLSEMQARADAELLRIRNSKLPASKVA